MEIWMKGFSNDRPCFELNTHYWFELYYTYLNFELLWIERTFEIEFTFVGPEDGGDAVAREARVVDDGSQLRGRRAVAEVDRKVEAEVVRVIFWNWSHFLSFLTWK